MKETLLLIENLAGRLFIWIFFFASAYYAFSEDFAKAYWLVLTAILFCLIYGGKK